MRTFQGKQIINLLISKLFEYLSWFQDGKINISYIIQEHGIKGDDFLTVISVEVSLLNKLCLGEKEKGPRRSDKVGASKRLLLEARDRLYSPERIHERISSGRACNSNFR